MVFLIFFFIFIANDVISVIEKLNLAFDEGLVHVELPFEYKSFTPFDKILNIYQQSYCILEPQNTKYDYAFLGPLSPCIGIIIRNPDTSATLVAHKDQYVSLESIVPSIQSLNNIENLEVHLFTCSMSDRYENERDGNGRSYKDHYQGRSQQEELEYLKHHLEEIGIKNEKIEITFFVPRAEFNHFYREYVGCQSSIVVDKQGKIFCTSQYKENLWKMKEGVSHILNKNKINAPENTEKHISFFFKMVSYYSKELVRKIRGGFNLSTSYGDLEFIKQF